MKTLESQHRTTLAFDAPMILFNDVVEIFALPDLDTLVVVIIVAFDRGRIGTTFVDIDEPRFTIPLNRFGQKSQCGLLIAQSTSIAP